MCVCVYVFEVCMCVHLYVCVCIHVCVCVYRNLGKIRVKKFREINFQVKFFS